MAKRFNFKLDPVLKLRSQKLEEAKNDLSQIRAKRIEKEKQIEGFRLNLIEHSKSRENKKKLEDILAYYDYKESLEFEIKKALRERDNLLDIESLKIKKVNDALKEEKIITNLKDKQFDEYKNDIKKEEISILDEISLRNFSMNKDVK